MSAEQADILEGIKHKILSLKSLLDEQKDENRKLKEDRANLKKELEEKDQMIHDLGDKNQKLSLASGIMADGDQSHEARVQINRIVREIDKCIALLNR